MAKTAAADLTSVFAMREDEQYSQVKPNEKAGFLPIRTELIALLQSAVQRTKIGRHAYFLALNYMDDVLSRMPVPAKLYRLVAVCCLFLAGTTCRTHIFA